jgi:hypothetical protein
MVFVFGVFLGAACSCLQAKLVPRRYLQPAQHQTKYKLGHNTQEFDHVSLSITVSADEHSRTKTQLPYQVSRFSLELADMPGYLAVLCSTRRATGTSRSLLIIRGVCQCTQKHQVLASGTLGPGEHNYGNSTTKTLEGIKILSMEHGIKLQPHLSSTCSIRLARCGQICLVHCG